MNEGKEAENGKICAGNNKQVNVTINNNTFFLKKKTEETWKNTRGFRNKIMGNLASHVKKFALNYVGNGESLSAYRQQTDMTDMLLR